MPEKEESGSRRSETWLPFWGAAVGVFLIALFTDDGRAFIFSTLDKIPATFLSAVTAAGITLLGVAKSNADNTTRLVSQQEHDTREKLKDRRMKLRQDVYMEATEAVAVALASYPNLPLKDEAPEAETIALLKAIAKITMVCDEATVLLVQQLNAQVGSTFGQLMALAQDARLTRAANEKTNQRVETISKSIGRTMDLRDDLFKAGKLDDEMTQRFNKVLERLEERQEKLHAKLESGTDEFLAKHVAYIQAMIEPLKPASETYLKTIVALRAELTLTTDAAALKRQWDENREQLQQLLAGNAPK